MKASKELDFETLPGQEPRDETDYSVRAYIARMPEDKLAQYDPSWTDEQVMEWDGNFRSDGNLMLVCCYRDADVQEFREVLEEYLEFRKGRELTE
jgi:hypothetical protein